MASIEVEYALEDGSVKGSDDENILGSPYGSMELEPFDANKLGIPTTNNPNGSIKASSDDIILECDA